MLAHDLVEWFLTLAALGQLVSLPAMAVAAEVGILAPEDLRKLEPINQRIVAVVLAAMQYVLATSAILVIWGRAALVNGGGLAAAIAGSLALLWAGRLMVQVRLYGPLFASRWLRRLHWGLVALFTAMAIFYAVAALHARLCGRW